MLHNVMFVLFVKHTDGRDMPVEPVAICDYSTWDENPDWMKQEKERQLKELGATEAKWVEMKIPRNMLSQIETAFGDIIDGGKLEDNVPAVI